MTRYLLVPMFLFSLAVNAEDTIQFYTAGDTIEPITLQDQNDKTFTIDESTKLVLFTAGMKGGKVVRQAIEKEEPDYLAKRNTVYLSNISGMPGFIAKNFAIPKMKEHKYSIVLDKEGNVTKRFPSQEQSTTIVQLDKLKIKSISFTSKPEDVTRAINQVSE